MKLIIIFLALLVEILFNVSAQVLEDSTNQTPQELYDFHISKHKANKTAGWITLGGGVAMIIGGIGWNMSGGILDSDTTNNNKGLWLSYLGGATTLTSIPLFIAAGKHKKKTKVQLQNGAIGLSNKFKYSGISISYSF